MPKPPARKPKKKQNPLVAAKIDYIDYKDTNLLRKFISDRGGLSVSLEARAGRDGRLFGSVTTTDIAAAVKDAGGPVLDRKRIQIDGHIKSTGTHTVTVDLHPDVVASVPVDVKGV